MTVQVSDRFVDTNGTRLFVMDRGRGRALVFLHGLGWDHTLWHGVTQAFAHEYRVIAGDTRGHGRSAKPDGPYTIALFAEDWFAAFKNLRVRQACLIGFSQGGMLACDTLLHGSIRADGLVMLSASRIRRKAWEREGQRLRGLPVLVSHGRRDADLAFAAGEGLHDFVRAAGARTTWVPFDGGHEIPLIVWRNLRIFLNALLN